MMLYKSVIVFKGNAAQATEHASRVNILLAFTNHAYLLHNVGQNDGTRP